MSQRVALVTGAGRGIGRAVALALAGQGLSLWLTARTRELLEEAAEEARGLGAPEATVHPADLTRTDDVEGLVRALDRGPGRLDVLVQNAGLFRASPLAETSDEEWDEVLALNLTAPFRLLKRCLPLLRRAEGGHVIHIASVAGRQAFAGCSAYCASKAGLLSLTAVAREELRGGGTKVTAVLPGAVDTPAWEEVEGDFDRSRMLRPEDVARAVEAAVADSDGAMTEELVLRPQPGDL